MLIEELLLGACIVGMREVGFSCTRITNSVAEEKVLRFSIVTFTNGIKELILKYQTNC